MVPNEAEGGGGETVTDGAVETWVVVRGEVSGGQVSAFFAAAEEEGSADRPRFIPFPLQRKFQDVTGLPYYLSHIDVAIH